MAKHSKKKELPSPAAAPKATGPVKKLADGMYKLPKDGEQSMAPCHDKYELSKANGPEGADFAGKSIALPKSGGVGEGEV